MPYCPNQFLGWDFFIRFLQQDSSSSLLIHLYVFANFSKYKSQYIYFLNFFRSKYQERDPSGVVANWIGLLIVVFCTLVVYLIANPRFKRLTRPEDEMLLTDRDGN